MKQIDRINAIMNKEKSPFRRRQMMKVLKDIQKRMEG